MECSRISIVVPCYNEAEVLPLLYDRLKNLQPPPGVILEFILVDDGSTDNTWEQIRSFADFHPDWNAIRLSRNFGHQRALWTGLQAASGDAILVIDADLQDPPELLEEFVRLWRQGNEVVYGVRRNRKEFWGKRLAYLGFYRLLEKIADIRIPLDSGDFCLMDRRVVDQLLQLQEPSPFIRGARAWVGYRQVPLVYDRDARAAGTEKYKLRQLFDLAVNGLFSYSQKPVRWLLGLGLLVAGLSLVLVVGALGLGWYAGSVTLARVAVILAGVIGMVGGLNLFGLGIVGEYVFKAFEATRSRPITVVAERVPDAGWSRGGGPVVSLQDYRRRNAGTVPGGEDSQLERTGRRKVG